MTRTGKEVLPAAEAVLLALGSDIPKPVFVPLLAGWEVFTKTGVALPQDTIDILKNDCDAAMFGSVRYVRRTLVQDEAGRETGRSERDVELKSPR